MKNTETMIDELYKEFRGLPNKNPIVRNGQREDAFPLAILKIEYGSLLEIDVTADNIEKIASRYIVAPPDSGIDMFIEIEDGDEYLYKVIQVKHEKLTESQIRTCYLEMKNSIKEYLKDANNVKPNLREVIQNSNFVKTSKDNCEYIIYHAGTVKEGKTLKDCSVATIGDLDTVLKNRDDKDKFDSRKVKEDNIHIESKSSYIEYLGNGKDTAYVCSINGYELAVLCDRYHHTYAGRNLLFGQNLRETLGKKSKTSDEMKQTIKDEPDRFWHYNNGITIIAEDIIRDKKDENSLELHNFSIINGAQTTGTLREYYSENKDDKEALAKLKSVYVLARLMKVSDDKKFARNIAIYNNSQNSISSRDMVSKNEEQEQLHKVYLNEEGDSPHIFIETTNGETRPSKIRIEKHQQTTNEQVAQIAFAAFLLEPFSAKNRRATLFTKSKEAGDKILINESYDRIFRYEEVLDDDGRTRQGILFRKSREDLDEALFIKYLYRLSRSLLRRENDDNINRLRERMDETDDENMNRNRLQQIESYQRNKEIGNTCMFYCITFYYILKDSFGDENEGTFDYFEFYDNRTGYKDRIVKDFSEGFLQETINIIADLLGQESNVSNWVRRARSQEEFISRMNNKLTSSMQFKNMYTNFIDTYKKRR